MVLHYLFDLGGLRLRFNLQVRMPTFYPPPGGQPALGARNTTFVLRQHLPALNISLELSRARRRGTLRHWVVISIRCPLFSRAPAGFLFFSPPLSSGWLTGKC